MRADREQGCGKCDSIGRETINRTNRDRATVVMDSDPAAPGDDGDTIRQQYTGLTVHVGHRRQRHQGGRELRTSYLHIPSSVIAFLRHTGEPYRRSGGGLGRLLPRLVDLVSKRRKFDGMLSACLRRVLTSLLAGGLCAVGSGTFTLQPLLCQGQLALASAQVGLPVAEQCILAAALLTKDTKLVSLCGCLWLKLGDTRSRIL
ncbi:hypothetical protein ACQEVF_57025 [Nonomuraea polychroma]|uniref:hypothetical protein n=1 Tax=Nonomuraea polychroma TaxID=46176 RepID=UPI003D8B9DC5